MQHIHCTVDNCYYWHQGNKCLAKEIVVTVDKVGAQYPDQYDAQNMTEFSAEIGTTPAQTCMETCCKTFQPSDKGPGPVQKLEPSEFPTNSSR